MKSIFSFLASAALLFTASATAADFAMRDGDRVVFLGDSITEQRLYTTYIEAYALTRHPEWKISFRNVGWGGDTSWLRQRARPDEAKLFAADDTAQQKMVEDSVQRGLDRDVLPLKPTFITIKFGMNDHSYQAFRPDIFSAYSKSQAQLNKVLSANGARVTFLTPQPIEDKRPDPEKDVRNQSLRKFSDGLKEVASKGGAGFVDMFAPYMGLMLAARAHDAQAIIGGGDAVHPGPAGQTLMAWAVLKGLNASALVSRVQVDVAKGSAEVERCQVSALKATTTEVSFDRLDDSLPFPTDERAESALKLAPVVDELSQYSLRVAGLAPGNYEISIDGETVLKTDAEALAKGLNLSNNAGAITKQAREVLGLVFQKNNTFFRRWRDVQLFNFPSWAKSAAVEATRSAELKRLDEEVAATEAKIDKARKPKGHRFVIKAITK
ncbi:MAG: SGNH/GDSL hydrolase family protein [Verrucomicrobiales bacterium]|nr:SGNH/GDSL hydrolase family protein [Verrucomicrobiales bacterium]